MKGLLARIISAIVAFSVVASVGLVDVSAADQPQLKALIVTGQNNHNWQKSTPILRFLLEQTGLFQVDVVTSPPRDGDMSAFKPDFAAYDVVVLDYNGKPWPQPTKDAFVRYVNTGGGVVVYHAADNAFPDWPEYNRIIGLGGWGNRNEKSGPYIRWRDGKIVRDTSPGRGGSHGARHAFQVVVRRADHPITAGLPEKWMHAEDELYAQLRGPAENLTVLATAYSDPQKGGTGQHEPVLFTIRYGQGRIFHTVLGHVGGSGPAPAVQCVGFITTFQRGAEWAATGKVTQPIPDDFPTAAAVSIRSDFLPPGQLDQLLADLSQYRYGQSRRALASMEHYLRSLSSVPEVADNIESRFLELLSAESTTFPARQFICKKLSIIGTEKSVPTLAAMLTQPGRAGYQPADLARYALERMPSPAAGKALRDALAKTTGKTKLGIINSIAQRRDRKAVPALVALMDGTDTQLAIAAIGALGKIGGPTATKELRKRRITLPEDRRRAWGPAFLNCTDMLRAEGKLQQAVTYYRLLAFGPESLPVRAAAFRSLVLCNPPKAAALLLGELARSTSDLRTTAIAVLRELPGDDVISVIAREYVKLSPESQIQVLQAFGRIGNRAALPAVLAAVSNPSADIRVTALEALGHLGDASHVALLAETAANASPDERRAAQTALYTLKPKKVDEKIIDLLPQASPPVKIELCRAIAERHITEAVDVLSQQAGSQDQAVRLAAVKALAEVAGPGDVAKLIDLAAATKDNTCRSLLQQAIRSVAPAVKDRDSQVSNAIQRLSKAADVETRCCLLRILGTFGGEKALAVVAEAVESSNTQISTTAVRALADWPDTAPMEKLRQLATGSADKLHRTLAFRGFVRMAGLEAARSPAKALEHYKEAMDLARSTDQKKLVLSGLSGLPTLEALRTAAGYLTDSDLKSEAEAAVVRIAAATCISKPLVSAAFVQTVLDSSQNPAIRQQAENVLKRVDQFGDYIKSWYVSGPYTRPGAGSSALFGIPFAPELPEQADQVVWKPVTAGTNPEKPYAVDLIAAIGGSDRAAYLRTYVWSPATQNVQLMLGSNDGIKVWLNGTVVHENNTGRTVTPDEDRVKVTLNKGWNELLMKITQSGGTWGACARFRSLSGGKLDGLVITPEKPTADIVSLIGEDLSSWRDTGQWRLAGQVFMDPTNPKKLLWKPGTGVIVNGPEGRTIDLLSRREFGDVRAHVEFMVPKGSNSGVYFMGRYEVQILDSWGVARPKFSDCGGIYQRWDQNRQPHGFEGHPPRMNASLPPGTWQSYDVIFRAPRFDADGNKIANARFEKVIHNGIVVHENVEVTGPTRAATYKDEKPKGPLMLQGDHGPVAYRNIWILPIGND